MKRSRKLERTTQVGKSRSKLKGRYHLLVISLERLKFPKCIKKGVHGTNLEEERGVFRVVWGDGKLGRKKGRSGCSAVVLKTVLSKI